MQWQSKNKRIHILNTEWVNALQGPDVDQAHAMKRAIDMRSQNPRATVIAKLKRACQQMAKYNVLNIHEYVIGRSVHYLAVLWTGIS